MNNNWFENYNFITGVEVVSIDNKNMRYIIYGRDGAIGKDFQSNHVCDLTFMQPILKNSSISNKIYSKKLSKEQNDALRSYEAILGLEPVGIEEFEKGEITSKELWNQAINSVESIYSEVVNMSFPDD